MASAVAVMSTTPAEIRASVAAASTPELADRLLEEFEELNKAILVDRNNRWVRQISALLDDEQDYLIVVGALHLVGDNGVPRQLHRQGAAVRQLSESATLR